MNVNWEREKIHREAEIHQIEYAGEINELFYSLFILMMTLCNQNVKPHKIKGNTSKFGLVPHSKAHPIEMVHA